MAKKIQLSNTLLNCIVESGSNTNGSWTKWADGTMICRQTFTTPLCPFTNEVVSGKLYQSSIDIDCPNYPVAFTEIGQLSVQPNNTLNMWGIVLFGDSTVPKTLTSAGRYQAVRFGTKNNGFRFKVDVIAIGKWK